MNPEGILSYQGRVGPAGVYRVPIVGMAGALPSDVGICMFDAKDLDTLRSVEELRDYEAAAKARIVAIDQEAAGKPLDDLQREEWAALNDAITGPTGTRARVTELEDRIATVKMLNDDPDHTEPAGAAPTGGVAKPKARRVPDNIYALDAYRQTTRSDGEYAQAIRDGAMMAADRASFPTIDKAQAQKQLERLLAPNQQHVDATALGRRILATGSPEYERAFGRFVQAGGLAGMSTGDIQALSLGVDDEGGFMVPFSLDPTIILTSDGVINPLRAIARVEQITGKKWQGVSSGGISVTRHPETAGGSGETNEADDNSPTLAQPEVETSRVEAFVPFTRELDASVNVGAAVAPLLADAKETEEAESYINGDGGANTPSGLIATLDGARFLATVGAGGFGPEDVYALKNFVKPRWRARGRFLGESGVYDLVRQFDQAGGSNLWVQLQDANPPRLVGYNAHEISTMDEGLGAGSHILAFGDFKQFLIVDRLGMAVDVIPHLFGPNGRPTGQRGIFAIWANGSGILVDNAFGVLEVGS